MATKMNVVSQCRVAVWNTRFGYTASTAAATSATLVSKSRRMISNAMRMVATPSATLSATAAATKLSGSGEWITNQKSAPSVAG